MILAVSIVANRKCICKRFTLSYRKRFLTVEYGRPTHHQGGRVYEEKGRDCAAGLRLSWLHAYVGFSLSLDEVKDMNEDEDFSGRVISVVDESKTTWIICTMERRAKFSIMRNEDRPVERYEGWRLRCETSGRARETDVWRWRRMILMIQMNKKTTIRRWLRRWWHDDEITHAQDSTTK